MSSHPRTSENANGSLAIESKSNTAPAAASTPSGRGNDGRFAKNNAGGPGNPFNRQVAALRKALLNRVTAEDIEEVLAILMIKAKSGDLAAIKLLLSYTIGKPGPAVEPDSLDQQEWELHQRAAVPPQQVHDLMDAVPVARANSIAQIAWPCAAQQQMQPVVAGLQAAEAQGAAASAPPASPGAMANARNERSATPLERARQLPPSANALIGEPRNAGPADQMPGSAPRPVPPRPPDLPEHIDWEYEQRINGILFGEEDSPPDTKRGN